MVARRVRSAADAERLAAPLPTPAHGPRRVGPVPRHHLALVGRQDPLFADDAVARLHRTSLGLPRALNNLARDALIAAAADGKALVDDACAKRAVAEAVSE